MPEWLSTLGTLAGGAHPLMADAGVSAETFRYVVGVFVAAFGAALGVIRQLYEKRLEEKDKTIAEQQKRLDAYGTIAPEVAAKIQQMLNDWPTPHTRPDSEASSTLPYPYGRSQPIHRPRRGTGGRP